MLRRVVLAVYFYGNSSGFSRDDKYLQMQRTYEYFMLTVSAASALQNLVGKHAIVKVNEDLKCVKIAAVREMSESAGKANKFILAVIDEEAIAEAGNAMLIRDQRKRDLDAFIEQRAAQLRRETELEALATKTGDDALISALNRRKQLEIDAAEGGLGSILEMLAAAVQKR